jgi:uncharacterized membrane protein
MKTLFTNLLPRGLCSPLVPAAITIWFAMVIGSLYLLKIRQVERELDNAVTVMQFQQNQSPDAVRQAISQKRFDELHGYHSVTGRGMGRRIDDPSLWFVVALAVTAASIFLAALTASRELGQLPSLRHLPAWRGWTCFLSAAYLLTVFIRKETFFFARNASADPLIVHIQIVEGCLILTAMVVGPLLLAIGLTYADAITTKVRSPDAITWKRLCFPSACLASAGFSALVICVLGVAICKFLNVFQGMFEPFSTATKFILLGQMLPFLYLGARVQWQLGDRFNFSKKNVMSLPDDVSTLVKLVIACVFLTPGKSDFLAIIVLILTLVMAIDYRSSAVREEALSRPYRRGKLSKFFHKPLVVAPSVPWMLLRYWRARRQAARRSGHRSGSDAPSTEIHGL